MKFGKEQGSGFLSKNMEQESLFEPIKTWLESHGFQSLVTGGKRNIVLPVTDLIPSKLYAIPDVIGVKGNLVAIVEAETKLAKLYETIGKCMLWKTMAELVYIAYPSEQAKKIKLLERLGVGLLGVSNGDVKEIIRIMLQEPLDVYKVRELHPLDDARKMELVRFITNIMENE